MGECMDKEVIKIQVECPICRKAFAETIVVPLRTEFASDCQNTQCELNFSSYCEFFSEHGCEELLVPIRNGCIVLLVSCSSGHSCVVFKS